MPRLEFGRRLRSRFWRPTPREEVDAELRFHLEMRARELERQGLTPEAARAEARRRFGDLSEIARECRSLAAGRNRRMDLADHARDLARDLRDAARHDGTASGLHVDGGPDARGRHRRERRCFLARQSRPAPSACGARAGSRAASVLARRRPAGASSSFAYPEFADLRAERAIADTARGRQPRDDGARGGRSEGSAVGEIASGGYFEIIGIRAATGRTLGPADDRRGAPPAALISHRYWTGGSPAIPQSSDVPSRSTTVPTRLQGSPTPGPTGSFLGAPVDVWVGLEPSLDLFGPDTANDRTRRVLNLLGRLAPGATAPQAQGELDAAARELGRSRKEEKLRLELGPGTLLHGGRRAMAACVPGRGDGARGPRAARRGGERRQPAAGARPVAPARDGRPHGAGRRARTAHPAARRGEPVAGGAAAAPPG